MRGRHSHGMAHGSAKLTDSDVRRMRAMREKTGATYTEIAKQFAVSRATATRIVKGDLWRHVH